MQPLWRIYYDNNTTFDSNDGTPNDAPPLGVICIVMPDKDVGRVIMHRWDWYYWKNNEWNGADIYGALDQFMHFPNDCQALKQGRTIPTGTFKEIYNRARDDIEFPTKSAYTKEERNEGNK